MACRGYFALPSAARQLAQLPDHVPYRQKRCLRYTARNCSLRIPGCAAGADRSIFPWTSSSLFRVTASDLFPLNPTDMLQPGTEPQRSVRSFRMLP